MQSLLNAKIGIHLFFSFSTFKNDCPVHISLRATSDGQFLEVKSCEDNHNHETNEVSILKC